MRLQKLGDIDSLRQRADRRREVDEFLELCLVLVRELARHIVAHHRHGIDDVFGGERIFGEVLARLLRVVIDEVDALLPNRREAPGDVGTALDEVTGDCTARRKGVAVLVAEDVLGDNAGLECARHAQLAHGRSLWLERIAGIEGAAGHDVDVLAHVELIDRVVALVEAGLGEHGLGGDQVGGSRRRHDARTFEVLERPGRVAGAHHELLHLINFALAVHADIHGDARLFDVGVHRLDGHEHDRRLDLVTDHRRDVRWPADEPDRLGLDVLLFEKAALDCDEIGKRGGGRKDPDLDLILRGGALAQRGGDGYDRSQRYRSDRPHRIASIAHGFYVVPRRACGVRASLVRIRCSLGWNARKLLRPWTRGEPGVRGLAEITAAMNYSLPDTWERLEFTAD